jgi:glycosyltransferase involved in cell wall biosynthesis
MVLTEFTDCMVCGAYEAVALRVPLILSDTPVLREWFDQGVVFTKNNSSKIADAILSAKKNYSTIQLDIKKLNNDLVQRWNYLAEIVLFDIRWL